MRPEGRGVEFFGAYGHDEGTGEYLLGPPIVQLGVAELVDEDSIRRMREVLQAWLELDYRNVIKYQIGLRRMELPMAYRTNEIPVVGGALELAWATEHTRKVGEQTALEAVRWLVTPWVNDGDYVGAMLGLLLLAHRHPRHETPAAPLLAGLASTPDRRALLAQLEHATGEIAILSVQMTDAMARFLGEPAEPAG